MSTHGTYLWLEVVQGVPGDEDLPGWIDIASDIGVDQCVRITVGEGDPKTTHGHEIHLNPDQAEDVANAILKLVAVQRRLGNDGDWAARTVRREKRDG
ncbi:hypothetical protein [Thermoactinospora rubra]|uniref:hypothetical protein n=1 Tax=Thermoactinospora rubra TaxID=1088767 RepID=UPI000A107145|nr:hypothetical protein [Thermoactinospora rubra]